VRNAERVFEKASQKGADHCGTQIGGRGKDHGKTICASSGLKERGRYIEIGAEGRKICRREEAFFSLVLAHHRYVILIRRLVILISVIIMSTLMLFQAMMPFE
jgi:hypothetical protein